MLHRSIDFSDLTPPLAEVYRYWQSLPLRGGLPSWSDFDMVEIPTELIPSTLVIDVADRMEDNRFRFWGSGMTQVHGTDNTGNCPYDLQPPELGERILKDQTAIVETRQPSAGVYGFVSARGYQEAQSLLRLPLSDTGERVDQIVIVVEINRTVMEEMQRTGMIMHQAIDRLSGKPGG